MRYSICAYVLAAFVVGGVGCGSESESENALGASRGVDGSVLPTEECKRDTLWASSFDTLYTVDPVSLEPTAIGKFGLGGEMMTDVAVAPDGGLFGVSFRGVYSIDVSSAKASALGRADGFNSLTFLADGRLVAADQTGKVTAIDLKGTNTTIGNYGSGYGASGDIAVGPDGVLYGTTIGDSLVRIDPNTGAATLVGRIGFAEVYGLGFIHDRLIGFTYRGQIIEIDRTSGRGALVKTTNIQFAGAAHRPC